MLLVRYMSAARRAHLSPGGVAVLVIGLVLIAERPALAYIDPGAGSLIYQALLAGLLGLGFALRQSREMVSTFFRSRLGARTPETETSRRDQP